MPINVGYQTMPSNQGNIGALMQQQQRMDYLKKQQQQAQMQKSIEAIGEAYKKMKEKQKTEKQLKELKEGGFDISYDSTGAWKASPEKKTLLDKIPGLDFGEGTSGTITPDNQGLFAGKQFGVDKSGELILEDNPYIKKTQDLQEKIASEGSQLNLNRNLPPKKQYETARAAYANIKGRGGKPAWGQEQKVASVRSGLMRGQGTITKAWGELESQPILTLEDAHRFIADKGLDPTLFKKELSQYEIVQTGNSNGRAVGKLRSGKVIYLDTKQEVK